MIGGEKMSAIEVIHKHRWEAGPQNTSLAFTHPDVFPRARPPLPDLAHPWSGSLLHISTKTHLIPLSALSRLLHPIITFSSATSHRTNTSPPPHQTSHHIPAALTYPWKRPLFCSCCSRMFSSFRGLGMNPISQPSFTRRPIHQSLLNFCRLEKIEKKIMDTWSNLRVLPINILRSIWWKKEGVCFLLKHQQQATHREKVHEDEHIWQWIPLK